MLDEKGESGLTEVFKKLTDLYSSFNRYAINEYGRYNPLDTRTVGFNNIGFPLEKKWGSSEGFTDYKCTEAHVTNFYGSRIILKYTPMGSSNQMVVTLSRHFETQAMQIHTRTIDPINNIEIDNRSVQILPDKLGVVEHMYRLFPAVYVKGSNNYEPRVVEGDELAIYLAEIDSYIMDLDSFVPQEQGFSFQS